MKDKLSLTPAKEGPLSDLGKFDTAFREALVEVIIQEIKDGETRE